MMGGGTPTPAHAMQGWYTSEEKLYDYSSGGFSKGTGHFTQIVWKSSLRLGCAAANTGNRWYWACHFAPGGNMRGRFSSEVTRPDNAKKNKQHGGDGFKLCGSSGGGGTTQSSG